MQLAPQPLKVCILAAGSGQRMHSVSPYLHKALLPINNKPVILHIIEKLPANCEIYIAVGYKSEQIKDFFSVLVPSPTVKFIDIENYNGEGSGPGTTLLQCKEHLDSPFLVVCADTLWDEALVINPNASTIFVHTADDNDLRRYCNISFDTQSTVTGIYDKTLPPENETFESFTGVVFIHNPEIFFKTLAESSLIAGEKQICSGLEQLVKQGQCKIAKMSTWRDVGTPENYLRLQNSSLYSFKKTSEDIFFIDGAVIKFFENTTVCKERIERFYIDNDVHPQLLIAGKNFYSFAYTAGDTLKSQLTPTVFLKFLNFCKENLWVKRQAPTNYKQLSLEFYKTRSLQRFDSFRRQHPTFDHLLPLQVYLENFDWNSIADASRCVRFHGDLQLDNVIYNGHSFQLIDFRQSYSGDVTCGDIYYDFAKLLSSLKVDFSSLAMDDLFTPAPTIANSTVYVAELKKAAIALQLDFSIIESLVPVVLLNMTALHNHRSVALRLAYSALKLINTSAPENRDVPNVSL